MKKVFIILMLAAIVFGTVSMAGATCDQARLKVVRMEYPVTYSGTGGYAMYVLAPPTVTPVFYYVYYTNSPMIMDHLNTAHDGHFTVRLIGDATTCGTSGTVRNGGRITKVYRDLFY